MRGNRLVCWGKCFYHKRHRHYDSKGTLQSAEIQHRVLDYPAQRQKRLPRFDVLYFPKAGREECYRVADTLCEELKLIDLPGGDKLRGTDMSFEVTAGVLHFLVSYNHFARTEINETLMGTLKIEQGGK